MSEMVERVAAILAEENRTLSSYKRMARTAIAAMREPTEAMLNAARKAMVDPRVALTVWEAMHDEALK